MSERMFPATDWEKMTVGEWNLYRLEPQSNGEERWSIGKFGPRMYLTCNEATAVLVVNVLAYVENISGKRL